ncbi:DUF1365 domain-containing protein [Actinomadura darangshiensis]|uniref:DUF1365 domain-containing protein n=1 Tax=Actinomadura darangshiensis TaxID=705336 RepID=UPI001FB66E8D|nr:DUF1365 domain-containing protein [Actinomadura darangshiensis]
MTPALYECTLTHVRPSPIRNAFRYGTYLWLIDLDEPPRLPWPLRMLAGFNSLDHGEGASTSIRDDLDEFLLQRGYLSAPRRILMLAHARVLGHVFNPLTVYWCFASSGELLCVVAEVHNTYGGRHRYLLHTDARGRAETGKEFYVSPFYPVEGAYRMSLPLPDERLALTIALHTTPGDAPFIATLRGTRRRANTPGLLAAFVRHPCAPLAGAVRIRVQGIRLYLRGLRPHPRPRTSQGDS